MPLFGLWFSGGYTSIAFTGTLGHDLGLLMSFVTVLSIRKTQFPQYYVNAGRSSFLQMLLGSHALPFFRYYLLIALFGGILLGIGRLLMRTERKRRIEPEKKA
jgi:hypothetical protein